MAINLKPLGDRVVVEPLEQEEMTASGLVLPETAKEKPQKGTVLAAGPGVHGPLPGRVHQRLRTHQRPHRGDTLTMGRR